MVNAPLCSSLSLFLYFLCQAYIFRSFCRKCLFFLVFIVIVPFNTTNESANIGLQFYIRTHFTAQYYQSINQSICANISLKLWVVLTIRMLILL